MIVSVVACGESASEWYQTPHDYSIGVNDCFKLGYGVNELIVVNSPKNFTPERLETIKRTKFDKVKTNSGNWDKIFPQNEIIRMQSFGKYLKKGHIYSSKSSPFVAMSIAFNMGATDVILHGCDYIDHPAIKDKLLNYEIRQIQNFTRLMADQGTKTWLAKDYGALKGIIPHWDSVLGKVRQQIIKNTEEFARQNFLATKEAMTQEILKQAQEDFKKLGYGNS